MELSARGHNTFQSLNIIVYHIMKHLNGFMAVSVHLLFSHFNLPIFMDYNKQAVVEMLY